MVKCTCKGENCPIKFWTESPNKIWMTDKHNNDTLMYVDANAAVAIIIKVRNLLLDMEKEEG